MALNNVALWHDTAQRTQEALAYFIRASEADPEDALPIYNMLGFAPGIFRRFGRKQQLPEREQWSKHGGMR